MKILAVITRREGYRLKLRDKTESVIEYKGIVIDDHELVPYSDEILNQRKNFVDTIAESPILIELYTI